MDDVEVGGEEDFGDGYFAPYQQVFFYQQDQDEDYVDNAGGQAFHQTKNKIEITLMFVINSFHHHDEAKKR